MFLALKEMKHSKLRYGLVIATIMLISYLIFVLTALAYGLAQSNRLAVDAWHARAIVLNEDADGALRQSTLTRTQTDDVTSHGPSAELGELGITASKDGGRDKTSAELLGIQTGNRPDRHGWMHRIG